MNSPLLERLHEHFHGRPHGQHPDRWHPRHVVGPAAIAALLLLLSFHQVVGGAVRHAQEHRAAVAQRDHAAVGCRGLAKEAARALCLSRLDHQVLAQADAPPLGH